MIAQASPNIAFIKYWGKIASTDWSTRNIGINPSLSMTLSVARTQTEVTVDESFTQDLIFLNDQMASTEDQKKISSHLDFMSNFLKVPRKYCQVKSSNNFPLGTGLASSASGFSALTLAATGALAGETRAQLLLNDNGLQDFSIMSRVGSGSAARSVRPYFMYWDGPSAKSVGPQWKLFDTVVMFSKEKKLVSSRDGHELALNSPLFTDRQKRLPKKMGTVLEGLEKRSLGHFGQTLEDEAIELHAIAQSGGIRYHTDSSEKFIKSMIEKPGRDYFFTLDAGPNVHIISERPVVQDLQNILMDLGLKAELWQDSSGSGPEFTA